MATRACGVDAEAPLACDCCVVSVILPVYNAMPWLPIAVRDMLRQDLAGEGIEVICADDASRDGSLAFLADLASLLGNRAVVEECDAPICASSSKKARLEAPVSCPAAGVTASSNPALVNMALRAAETADHPSFADQEEPEDMKLLRENPITAQQVAAECRPEHRLRILKWKDGVNRGQGAAMTLCLSRVKTPFVAQMESDDEREDPRSLAKMLGHLRQNEQEHGVSCLLKTIGWDRPGMQRYVDWQNSCVTGTEMSKGRFIEIPALHQTAMFHTQTVLEVTGGAYRDGTADEDDLDVPVDMWWWLSFFHHGKRCSKICETLFGWRQHPRQHTRTHGRLSIDNLRRIKVHFLLRPGGPVHGRAVEVWSVGKSLDEWETALMAHPNQPPSLVRVSWKPGMPLPDRWKGPPRPKNTKRRRGCAMPVAGAFTGATGATDVAEASDAGGECDRAVAVVSAGGGGQGTTATGGVETRGKGGTGVARGKGVEARGETGVAETGAETKGEDAEKGAIGGVGAPKERPVRLFVFGMAKARKGVSAQVRDWDNELDWFVA